MKTSSISSHEADNVREVGELRPDQERAQRALCALDEDRLVEADKHITALAETEPIDHAWKKLLLGRLAAKRRRFDEAEEACLKACGAGLVAAGGESGALGMRVACHALSRVGKILRRQEKLEQARSAHLAAFRIADQHGSYEDLWEIATQLGLDADALSKYEDAQLRHREASESAKRCRDDPHRRCAIALENLTLSLKRSGLHGEAVDAARSARTSRQLHDSGDTDAARADLVLGTALLGLGESLVDSAAQDARDALDEGLKWLHSACESLLAFGPPLAIDARKCADQIDFGNRLRATCEA